MILVLNSLAVVQKKSRNNAVVKEKISNYGHFNPSIIMMLQVHMLLTHKKMHHLHQYFHLPKTVPYEVLQNEVPLNSTWNHLDIQKSQQSHFQLLLWCSYLHWPQLLQQALYFVVGQNRKIASQRSETDEKNYIQERKFSNLYIHEYIQKDPQFLKMHVDNQQVKCKETNP